MTLIASDVGERRETLVLPELKYVEIIAATASSGADHDVQADVKDGDEQELASTNVLPFPCDLCRQFHRKGGLSASGAPCNCPIPKSQGSGR